MQKIYTSVLLLSFFFLGKTSFAQISLSQTTVANYVEAICGAGVSYSNVTLTGDAAAIARFTGGTSAGLGSSMNNGVVLSTGYVNTAGALTGSAVKDGWNSGGAISQLTSIAGATTYDGIILEFDFVPITNQIDVNFQFGSEEYNWYVESSFNDAFAFYISGTGITGSQNIAVVPSTSTPVTINSINNGYASDWWGDNDCSSGPCTNCAYYNDNCNSSFNNAMNGFTTVLTASQAVVPCETYHIRLMLADGGDDALDSWVFIQQDGLFSVGTPPLTLAATYPFGTALYEECFNTNTITFTIPTAQPSDYSFNVSWAGTATSGVDYSALPTSVTILAGQTSVNLPIDVFTDGIAEGIETLECTYPISVCENGTAIINIDDAVPLTVDAGPDTDVCGGVSPADLTAAAANGNGAVTYSWDNGAGNTQSVSVLPAATTTYTVTATDQCGRTATDQVIVAVGTPPVIDAGSNTAVCEGSAATLTASGAVSYSWDNGVGAVNGVAVSPAATTTYTVTGTAANGCQSTDQVTVTVNPLPVVNAGTDQAVCNGTAVTLSGSGATSYTWDNSVSDGAAFTPSSTQTYTVTGTGTGGCQNTDQVVVTVNPLPVVNAGTDQAVCEGTAVTLSGSGATSYTWDNSVSDGAAFTPSSTQTYTVTGTGTGGCQGSDQVVVTVNPLPVVSAGTDQAVCTGAGVTLSGSGADSFTWNNGVSNGAAFTPASTLTYTVTGTDVNNCQNTDQVVVTVNPLPVVNGGVDQAVCAGQTITLSGAGAVSYAWNNGGQNGVAFVPAATQTYTVTGTNANGCQNTDQVLVTVNPLPNVNAGADQAVCAGESVTLSGSGAASYSWNNGGQNGVAFTPAATQTYTVTGTGAGGCQNTDQVVVTVNPLPNVGAGADQIVCVGDAVVLSGSGAASYAWSNGIQNGVSFTANANQVYTVTGTDANGCVNTATVTVAALPVPEAVIVTSGALSGLPGLTVGFANASTNAVTYSWVFGNGQTDVTTDITDTYQMVYNNVGAFEVTLTADNGVCEATTQQTIVITLPPVVVEVPNVFTPNGDGENDVFNLYTENAASIKVSVFNRWGNLIAEYDQMTAGWDGRNDGGEDVTEGVYFFLYDVLGVDGNHTTGQAYVELFR